MEALWLSVHSAHGPFFLHDVVFVLEGFDETPQEPFLFLLQFQIVSYCIVIFFPLIDDSILCIYNEISRTVTATSPCFTISCFPTLGVLGPVDPATIR